MEPSELIPVGCTLHQWGSYRRTVRAWNHGTHPPPEPREIARAGSCMEPKDLIRLPPVQCVSMRARHGTDGIHPGRLLQPIQPDGHSVINWRALNVGDMDPTLHDQMTGTTRE